MTQAATNITENTIKLLEEGLKISQALDEILKTADQAYDKPSGAMTEEELYTFMAYRRFFQQQIGNKLIEKVEGEDKNTLTKLLDQLLSYDCGPVTKTNIEHLKKLSSDSIKSEEHLKEHTEALGVPYISARERIDTIIQTGADCLGSALPTILSSQDPYNALVTLIHRMYDKHLSLYQIGIDNLDTLKETAYSTMAGLYVEHASSPKDADESAAQVGGAAAIAGLDAAESDALPPLGEEEST